MCLTAVLASDIHASFITMETGFGFKETDGSLMLRLSTRNRGDEPAYAVQFEASIGKAGVTGKTVPRLNVDQQASEEFEIKDAFGLPGHYPLVIKTHYQDANSYRFSSLGLGFYDYQSPVISDISVKGEPIDISSDDSGKLRFTLRNSGDEARMLSLDLHVPNELSVAEGTRTLRIGPKSEETMAFTVKNFSALENSSYAVFLLAQYTQDEKHHSTSSSTIVHIKPMSEEPTPSVWLVITLSALAVLGLAVLLVRRKEEAE